MTYHFYPCVECGKAAAENSLRCWPHLEAAATLQLADRQAHGAEMAAARDADRVARRAEGGGL